MVLGSKFFNGNLTSLQSEGTHATSPSPLLRVSVTNKQVKALRKQKEEAVFSTEGNRSILFHKL